MIEERYPGAGHDLLRYRVDLAVHHELLLLGQLHEDDPKVGPAEVQGQELAVLRPVGQLTHVGRKALHAGTLVGLLLQPNTGHNRLTDRQRH